ncbi:hypothetical protein D5018_02375 [Parashewanella curva]|uniref:N-acetylglucosamine binding protein A domain-containing protein n=1 Tax=Parashewanella curva TaxID=2338552 RepID=A0A3L8Q194_9GAMM|nr:hypothetical protein [Parashewanella curva]RLV61344.1 hypothetical protein D5018_02375 [Parashewanella curva]
MQRSSFFLKSMGIYSFSVMLWGLFWFGSRVQAVAEHTLVPAIHKTSFSTVNESLSSSDIAKAGDDLITLSETQSSQCNQQEPIISADGDGRSIIGRIVPSRDLKVGDKVTVKVYDKSNRLLPNQLALTINSSRQGKAKQWAFQLAYNINHKFAGLRAGQADNTGGVTPKHSCNLVYASPFSTVGRLETVFTIANPNVTNVETVDNSNPVTMEDSQIQIQ